MTHPNRSSRSLHVPAFLERRVALIVSLGGVCLLSFHLWHAIVHPRTLLTFVTGILLPALVAVVLIAMGLWAVRRRLAIPLQTRLTAWTYVGGLAMALSMGMLLLHQHVKGDPLADAPFIMVNAVTGGLIGGFVVGVFDARQRRHADRLTAINEAMHTLMHLQSKEAVCEHVVSVAKNDLGMPITGIWLYEEAEVERLVPVAIAGGGRFEFDEPPVYTPGNSLSWEVFEAGDTTFVETLPIEQAYNPETPLASEIIVPLGRFGVLNIGSFGGYRFDRADVITAELLGRSTTEALERTDRETELRRHHEDLEQRTEQLERFTKAVSHDLRNPLTVADGHLSLYRETGDETHLTRAANALGRMESIIDDILWLATEGKRIGDREAVELETIVERAWTFVGTREATLTVDGSRTLLADPDRLQQALENLFRNGVEHGGERVALTVGTIASGFYVEDDGPGIPVDVREKVFEMGYTTDPDGTGFGLAIVSEIVRAHGWNIRILSGTEDGARFEITVPPGDRDV